MQRGRGLLKSEIVLLYLLHQTAPNKFCSIESNIRMHLLAAASPCPQGQSCPVLCDTVSCASSPRRGHEPAIIPPCRD